MQPAGVIQKTRLVPQLGLPCPSPGRIPTKDALWVLGCYGAIREVKDTERGDYKFTLQPRHSKGFGFVLLFPYH